MKFCAAEAQRYRRGKHDVVAAQAELLRKNLQRNRQTEFGRAHDFSSIAGVDDFRERVPLSTYEDVAPWIEKIAAGEQNVLTAERVLVLEPTSGTSSGEKLIPYTAELRREFQRAIRVWIHDLFSSKPELRAGKSYWSISPLASRHRQSAGGIPIGFDHDAAYLATVEQWWLSQSLAVPAEVAACDSVAEALYATVYHLLKATDLTLVSVWSPTFFSALLTCLRENGDRLCEELNRGGVGQTFEEPLPDRAAEVRSLLKSCGDSANLVQALWPRLSLISCWADGPSRFFANDLREQVGPIPIQGKGLLATEALMTVPLLRADFPALAYRSHFFEFLPRGEQESGETKLAHELDVGQRYDIVVTTGGGLYRYRIGDEVHVQGYDGQVPLLSFLGRTSATVDLVGEKLSEAHVQQALEFVFSKLNLEPTFSELVAEASPQPRYRLNLSEPTLDLNQGKQRQLLEFLEKSLRTNPGYRYARDLDQLGELEIAVLSPQEARQQFLDNAAAQADRGVRYGDLKPTTLSRS